MKKQDGLDIVGTLKIWVINPDGTKTLRVDDKNVKTSVGQDAIANILAGKLTSHINQMAIGDGGINMDYFTPIAPTKDDTGLSNELFIVGILSNNITVETHTETVTGNPIIIYKATFASAESDNWRNDLDKKVINEAGLFIFNDPDRILVCRKTFASIPFDDADGVQVLMEWALEVK